MQKKTRKYVQGKCVSNTQECQTHQQPYKVFTRLYKDQLEGVLDIRKVREAQICRWKKILPHSRGETVTQISSFTSQRYKVLWGLAKSDNIYTSKRGVFRFTSWLLYSTKTLELRSSQGVMKSPSRPPRKWKQDHLFLVHPRSPEGGRGENM